MTTKDTPASLEDLFNDTDKAQEFENEIFKSKAEEAANQFVPVAMRLKIESGAKHKELNAVVLENVETRNLNITLPKAAWDGLDLMVGLFDLMEEHNDSSLVPQDVRSMMKDGCQLYEKEMDETIVSQAALVNLSSFIEQMATSALIAKVSSAMSSPDKLDQLERVLKEIEDDVGDLLDELEENDE